MMQTILVILMLVMLGLAIWIVASIFSARVSQPNYKRLAIRKGYEIRKYDTFIEATTFVSGPYKAGLYEGFRRVGGYIFGNNKKNQSISMTAPVLDSTTSDKKRRISFVMPEGFTMRDLPQPEDSRVKLVSTPSHSVAVLQFRGPISNRRVAKKEAQLVAMLHRDRNKIIGNPRSARYSPPWTFPLIARNEIHIVIASNDT
jgi:hypothetical protein